MAKKKAYWMFRLGGLGLMLFGVLDWVLNIIPPMTEATTWWLVGGGVAAAVAGLMLVLWYKATETLGRVGIAVVAVGFLSAAYALLTSAVSFLGVDLSNAQPLSAFLIGLVAFGASLRMARM